MEQNLRRYSYLDVFLRKFPESRPYLNVGLCEFA